MIDASERPGEDRRIIGSRKLTVPLSATPHVTIGVRYAAGDAIAMAIACLVRIERRDGAHLRGAVV